MRKRRIKVVGQTAVYHCITRVVGGAYLLEDDRCKEVLVKQIRKVAGFCGVEVITYCVMSNHFHVLVRVREDDFSLLTDVDLLDRCRFIYGSDDISMLQWENRLGDPERREQARETLIKRMGDVSQFMKEIKQRFSLWYNKTHDRYGTLWAERFKSVLVENQWGALSMVAAYIDLNPVRAGIVEDPKDYRFCGYSYWLAGGRGAVVGLYSIFMASGYSCDQAIVEYRKLLYGVGYQGKTSNSSGLSQERVREVLNQREGLDRSALLRHRIRYFTDGAILGSKCFVQQCFHAYKHQFSDRKTDHCSRIFAEDLSRFENGSEHRDEQGLYSFRKLIC